MTVEINQKRLYYNYYTSNKFLTLKFKFQINPPPPPTSGASLRPCSYDEHVRKKLGKLRLYRNN
jgi:hypothetical protein